MHIPEIVQAEQNKLFSCVLYSDPCQVAYKLGIQSAAQSEAAFRAKLALKFELDRDTYFAFRRNLEELFPFQL